MVSAGRRGEGEEGGRRRVQARPNRRPGRGRPGKGRPGPGEGEEGEGEEAGEVGVRGRGNGKKKPGRPGQWNKKKGRKPSFFVGSVALKKCSLCVLKCKKVNRVSFGQCLSTNETSPCYSMCAQASDNMLDCLTCIGECSGTVNEETGKKENAWTCVKKPDAPCKERCALPTPAPTTEEAGEGEGDGADSDGEDATPPPPPPARHWYSWFF